MEIVWLGHSCFRLKARAGTVIIDPYQKETGLTLGKQSADIVLVTHDHPGHNHDAAVSGARKVVKGPGEYEIQDILITGVRTYHDNQNGKLRGRNTVYLVRLDDIVVCHLGDLGHILSSSQVEELDDVDVLMAPVGGETTIGASEAAEVISLIEPKIVIPMHYQLDGVRPDLDTADKFLREMGLANVEAQAKLTVSKSGLPEETQVVVMERRRS